MLIYLGISILDLKLSHQIYNIRSQIKFCKQSEKPQFTKEKKKIGDGSYHKLDFNIQHYVVDGRINWNLQMSSS